MKQTIQKSTLFRSLGALGVLGLVLATTGPALAKQEGRAPGDQTPKRERQRQSLERVQLEEQLIRSDATAVMLGEWLSLREAGGASR